MPEDKKCTECGTPLDPSAAGGLCPNCLMKLGLQSQSGAKEIPIITDGQPQSAPKRFIPPPLEEVARAFPQLEILELLGQGGMGVVYKVRQRQLGRLAALKLLPTETAQASRFAERFTREARALAALAHPNIVTVYDFGLAENHYYILMEYVDGTDLRHVLQTRSLPAKEALAIVPQICEALQYAHGEGIVHRDVKPENILMDKRGRVKIADFGLAKLLGLSKTPGTLTGSDQVVGTAQYMAPEQIEHPAEVDHRADIYSLGVIIYEMLTGELPLGRFAPPSQKVQVDVRLDDVVLKTLAKEPELRYQHAVDVKTAVETISSSQKAPPRPAATAATLNENQWALFIHLSQFFGFIAPIAGLLVPFILWQIKKNESKTIDLHGRIVINWLITELILFVLFLVLCLVVIGIPLLVVLGILGIVFPIIGGIKANDGVAWPYPFSINFLTIEAQPVEPSQPSAKSPLGCLAVAGITLCALLALVVLCFAAAFLVFLGPSTHHDLHGHLLFPHIPYIAWPIALAVFAAVAIVIYLGVRRKPQTQQAGAFTPSANRSSVFWVIALVLLCVLLALGALAVFLLGFSGSGSVSSPAVVRITQGSRNGFSNITANFGLKGPALSAVAVRESDFAEFSKVNVSSGIETEIVRTDRCRTTITADNNLLGNVITEQEGGTLKIHLAPGSYNFSTLKARIELPVVKRIDLSGACHGKLAGFTNTDTLEIVLSGASSLTGSIQTGALQSTLGSASSMSLAGSAKTARLNGSDASKFNLAGFHCDSATVNLSGASSCSLDVAQQLGYDLSGASSLTYTGSPKIVSKAVSGASQVNGDLDF